MVSFVVSAIWRLLSWCDGLVVTTRPYARVVGVTSTIGDVDLLGVTEVAQLLGISRQRVQQLTETDPDFPEPTATMARGRVWSRATIEKWAKATGREIVGEG